MLSRVVRGRAAAPVAPIVSEPGTELWRRLLIDPGAEAQRLPLQRHSAPIDPDVESPLGRYVGELRRLRGHPDSQNGKIVIVAQVIRKLVEIVDHSPDGCGPDRPQQLQLMAQVFRLLAPFVQRRVGRRFAYGFQCFTTLTIHFSQPRTNN